MKDGGYSFSGRYSLTLEVIPDINWVSWYEPMSDYAVKEISRALKTYSLNQIRKMNNDFYGMRCDSISKQEYNDLKRMFIAYAKINAELRSSW
jgi:hypothetical protein